MILSAVSTPLLGMVDTAVVGHLPDVAYLGAVAVGATIFSTLFLGLNFLRMGTTGVAAQAFGAGDDMALREALGQAGVVALILAGLILVLQAPVLELAMRLLDPDAGVDRLAREYFMVRIWSAPAVLMNYVFMGWLLGLQNARGPLAMVLSINISNIVLDLLLVVGLNLDVRGVAAASVIAELIGLAVGLTFVRAGLASRGGSWADVRLADMGRYVRILKINRDLFLRTLSLMFVLAFITAQGARMGSVILAANAVLMNFQVLMSYSLDGIAYAAEALTGKAIGERNREGLRLSIRRGLIWSLGFAALFSVAYLLAGRALIEMLTGLADVRAAAVRYLPWLILSPLISVWSFFYDGVYVGATRSHEMMIVMAGSALLLFLPAWYVFTGGMVDLGNHGLWLAFMVFMAGRGLGMPLWWQHLMRNDMILPASRRPDST